MVDDVLEVKQELEEFNNTFIIALKKRLNVIIDFPKIPEKDWTKFKKFIKNEKLQCSEYTIIEQYNHNHYDITHNIFVYFDSIQQMSNGNKIFYCRVDLLDFDNSIQNLDKQQLNKYV